MSLVKGPNFLCIGAQKSGTTWLYKMLNMHPQIAFPTNSKKAPIKEVHFWDIFYKKGLDWYLNLFKNREDKIMGDITPAYSILPKKKIKEIYELNKNLPIILIIRNPIERAWSLAQMNVKNNNLDYDTIDKSWFIDQFNLEASIQRGDYAKIIENWSTIFSSEQILLINYNDIKNNPVIVLKKIADHIGIDTNFFDKCDENIFKEKVFSNTKGGLPKKYFSILHQIYDRRIEHAKKKIPWNINDWHIYPYEEKILFIHIPKTAGTSFRLAMKKTIGDKLILNDYNKESKATSKIIRKKLLGEITDKQLEQRVKIRGIKYIGGHFNFNKYRLMFKDFKRVTFVREPLQRLYSEYNHRRRLMNLELSFTEYIELPRSQLRLKQLFKDYNNLGNMDFIGFTEYYDESIKEFNEKFGYDIQVIKKNMAKKSTKYVHPISQKDRDRFNELNKEDIEIYNELLHDFKIRNNLTI